MSEFMIEGCVSMEEEMTDDEFINAFIEWVESNGWSFGGGVYRQWTL